MFWEFKSQAILILCNTEEDGQSIRNLASCFGSIPNGLSQSQCAFWFADKLLFHVWLLILPTKLLYLLTGSKLSLLADKTAGAWNLWQIASHTPSWRAWKGVHSPQIWDQGGKGIYQQTNQSIYILSKSLTWSWYLGFLWCFKKHQECILT